MDEAAVKIAEILKKYKLKNNYEVAFPQYKILPDEVKLAILILKKHEMKIHFILQPIEEK